VLIGSENKA